MKSFAFSFTYAFFCLFFSFMYSCVSLTQSLMMFYYSKLWECMLQKPRVPTAYIGRDCNQTWQGIVKQAGALDLASLKGSDKSVV